MNILFALTLIILAILSPFLLIWSVNELMEQASVGTQIAYNFWSWLAALVICFMLNNSANKSN